jgi:glutamate-1-semialdehyde 2,1-aminomutase
LAGLAAATAAVKRYRELGATGEYAALARRSERLAHGLTEAFAQAGIPCHINQQASMLQLFLSADEPEFERFSRVDQRILDLFFLAMIAHGVVLTLPTSNHVYLSFAHGDSEIDLVLATARDVLRRYPFNAAFTDAA